MYVLLSFSTELIQNSFGHLICKFFRKTGVAPSVIAKTAIGYNGRNWCVGLNALGSAYWTKGNASPKQYYLPAGSIRLSVSKRFNVKKHEKHS